MDYTVYAFLAINHHHHHHHHHHYHYHYYHYYCISTQATSIIKRALIGLACVGLAGNYLITGRARGTRGRERRPPLLFSPHASSTFLLSPLLPPPPPLRARAGTYASSVAWCRTDCKVALNWSVGLSYAHVLCVRLLITWTTLITHPTLNFCTLYRRTKASRIVLAGNNDRLFSALE